MAQSGHVDTFARDNLPPREQWPEFKFGLPELQYPERLNCVTEWVDRWVEAGQGGRPCLLSPAEELTYAQLNERINRIANVLTRDLGMVPGNRVLLRAANNPMILLNLRHGFHVAGFETDSSGIAVVIQRKQLAA